jgi:periplasmic copper chaperone A
MTNSFAIKFIAACAGVICAPAAFSHVSLESRTAAAGTYYKAVFGVGHGCDGAATRRVAVQIPDGFRGAKPMPKPGWTVTAESAKLATPYDDHGKPVTQDVRRVTWQAETAKAALPDAHFDQFTVRGKLYEQAGPMWFKVLQTCDKGQNDWSEIPVSGTAIAQLKWPAALLEVSAPAAPVAMPVAAATSEVLQVSDAWVRGTVGGQRGTGAFMKITARENLRLVGVTSPIAGVAEVHEMKMEGDVMKMRALPALDLPAGKTIELKAGGNHLMLMDLKQPLLVNSTVALTLRFVDSRGAEKSQLLNLPVTMAAPAGANLPADQSSKVKPADQHKH